MDVSLNCVICNQVINCEGEGDENGEEVEEECISFQLGLQLLYKLLKHNGTTATIKDSFYFGQAVGKLGSFSKAPCCEECRVVFGEVVRLQQAIEDIQMTLMRQVDKLKNSLLTSIPPEFQEDPLKIPDNQDAFEHIREQLLSSVRDCPTASATSTCSTRPIQRITRNHTSIIKRKHGPPSRSHNFKARVAVPPKKPKEYLPCSVVLERIPPSTQNLVSKPTLKTDDEKENSEAESDPEFVPSPPETGSFHNNDDSDDDDYPWESEAPPVDQQDTQIKQENPSMSPPPHKLRRNAKQIALSKFKNISNKIIDHKSTSRTSLKFKTPKPPVRPKLDVRKFYIIFPDTLLLYQTTFIKVFQGHSTLICQEPHCPTPKLSSEDPLNWNSVFSKMAQHIDSTHDNPEASSYLRSCPLCPVQLKGRELRAHLIGRQGVHHVEPVLCDICLKPIKNISDYYRAHQWNHKNDQEKRESLEGPPKSLSKKSPLSLAAPAPSSPPPHLVPQLVSKLDVRKFSIIFPEKLLLYQTTLIKVLPGHSHLICQEPRCPSPEYSPEDPLNWNSLFSNMATHIDTIHKVSHLNSRPCPVCGIEFKGRELRAHLIGRQGVHHLEQVTCEICLKPVRNVSDNYKRHQWRHKNHKDKMELLEPGPSQKNRNPLTKVPKQPIHRIPIKLDVKKFSVIFPDKLLLYQTTLIKVVPGYSKLICQEPDCPSPEFFLEDPLNWNSLFCKFSEHIDTVHEQAHLNLRPCPVCGIQLKGKELRAHLVGKYGLHRLQQVICQLCLKPVRNVADNFREHQWRHKNSEEKINCLEGPPSKLRNKFNQLTIPPEIKSESAISSQRKAAGLGIQKFWQISPEILLYQQTLIKVAQGYSQLICQGQQCPSPLFSSSDDPLNWNSLFSKMAEHITSTHYLLPADQLISCPICDTQLKGKELRFHLIGTKGVHRVDQVVCEICLKTMKSENYRRHQWRHKNENEKQKLCEGIPPLEFYKRQRRKRELKGPKEPFKRFICKQCGKGFKGRALLGYHEEMHLPKELRKHYKCPQCPKLYLDQAAVRGHIEREHNRELMRWRVCPICGRKYNYRSGDAFRTHLRSHRNERPFVCETCGMAFLSNDSLKRHRKIKHEGEGERRWQCEFCEMSYKERSHLRRHRKSAHKEEVEGEVTEEERVKATNWEHRPDFIGPRQQFPCPACEKVFPLRSRMKKHFDKFCKAK